MIRNSSLSGFPSILIEHGFITNSGDANIIKTTINQQNVIAKKVIVLWIRKIGDEINERTREDLGRD